MATFYFEFESICSQKKDGFIEVRKTSIWTLFKHERKSSKTYNREDVHKSHIKEIIHNTNYVDDVIICSVLSVSSLLILFCCLCIVSHYRGQKMWNYLLCWGWILMPISDLTFFLCSNSMCLKPSLNTNQLFDSTDPFPLL